MATQFQNRLIGTVILVSLGVLFLPDLLMGKKNDIAAPAGSMPLRPEQSLAGTGISANNQSSMAVSTAPSGAASSGSSTQNVATSANVVVANNSGAKETAVAQGKTENWQVEEVAAPVTITEKGAVTSNNVVTNNTTNKNVSEPSENELKKAKELEIKKKEAIAAAKAKEAALEAKRKAELEALQSAKSVTTEQTATKSGNESKLTVQRDESGLTIKTPAQVEAERAAMKSGAGALHSNTTTKSVSASNNAWIIQVGVFSNAENAKMLAEKLHSAGYNASAQRAGQLTRVVVGPDVSRDKLQGMLSGINRIGGTSARVISYSAINN